MFLGVKCCITWSHSQSVVFSMNLDMLFLLSGKGVCFGKSPVWFKCLVTEGAPHGNCAVANSQVVYEAKMQVKDGVP